MVPSYGPLETKQLLSETFFSRAWFSRYSTGSIKMGHPIYTADLLRLFGPDNTKCSLIAYADDLVVYNAGRKPDIIKNNLQSAINKIFDFYQTWKLRVNTDKYETILFRPSLKRAKHPIQKQYKNFFLKDANAENKLISNKKVVKYLH